MKLFSMLTVFLLVAVVADSNAEQAPLTIYRNVDGELTDESHKIVKDIRRLAQRNGYVTLWLTLDFEINLYLDADSQQDEIVAQGLLIQESFQQILRPLAANRKIWYPKAGPHFRGPGTLIRANTAGLQSLVRNERIVQILAIE